MSDTLGRRILLGVTGSIAAYKTPELIRRLREQHYDVRVVLTSTGKVFVAPLSLQAVSQHKVYEGLTDLTAESDADIDHIELARWPDVILVAPTSANFLAKLGHGFADDLLSALCLASRAPIILAPAMNEFMWGNAATQANVELLRARGCLFLGPVVGDQVCGSTGPGRMLDPLDIVAQLAGLFVPFLKGRAILVTAGPTQEFIDPVRYLSNRSSGKMGFALAKAAADAGADVTVISGPVAITPPERCRLISVKTAVEMLHAVRAEIRGKDVFISAAAVADYQVTQASAQKIKKTTDSLTLTLKPTTDILKTVVQLRIPELLVVGFSAETEDVLRLAEEKRLEKGVDLMIVNDVTGADIGFDSDENAVTLLSEESPVYLARASKRVIAQQILEAIVQHLEKKEAQGSLA